MLGNLQYTTLWAPAAWYRPRWGTSRDFSSCKRSLNHTTQPEQHSSPLFQFVFFPFLVPGTSTAGKETMPRQIVLSKPNVATMKTRQSLRCFWRHRREILTAISRKGPHTCLYLDYSKCYDLNQPLILFFLKSTVAFFTFALCIA